MPDQFSRTRMLLGDAAVKRLSKARVLVFGIGGVGSFACEALARVGVGTLVLVDHDDIALTNINRQLVALHSTLGQKKVDVMAARIRDINPTAVVETVDQFFSAETAGLFDFAAYDYVVDAIDTVSAKLLIAECCHNSQTPLISATGTGNKLDPTKLTVGDIYETSGDPLARVFRRELKKRGIPALKVVWSTETPRKPVSETDEALARRSVPASVSFVPPAAGMMLAGEVVRDLVRDCL
ncbi:tRNA threonylcarbamoyladenosine dehydratase [Oscillospiraceae bacterium WX1]